MKLTENHNLSADIRDANGNQKVMLDAGYVAEHKTDVQAETETFIREAIHRASGEIATLPTASGAE